MPLNLDLVSAWRVRVTALDSSGNTVPGVNVGPVSIIAAPLGTGSLDSGPFTAGVFALISGPGG